MVNLNSGILETRIKRKENHLKIDIISKETTKITNNFQKVNQTKIKTVKDSTVLTEKVTIETMKNLVIQMEEVIKELTRTMAMYKTKRRDIKIGEIIRTNKDIIKITKTKTLIIPHISTKIVCKICFQW